MEFRFNVNEVFKQPIVEITNNLIPPDYTGNRRMLTDTVSKVSNFKIILSQFSHQKLLG